MHGGALDRGMSIALLLCVVVQVRMQLEGSIDADLC